MNKYTDWIEKEKFKEKIERKRWEECSGAGEYRNGKADAYEDVLNIIDQLDKTEVLPQEWIDKKRLIERVENYIPLHDKTVGDVMNSILEIIKQLPELEVLSPDWIDENQHPYGGDYQVPSEKLENLLVPKQEITEGQVMNWLNKNDFYDHITAETVLERAVDKGELSYYGTKYSVIETPTIPKYVAEWIEEAKDREWTLYGAMSECPREVEYWLIDGDCSNQDTFARAWLDGFTIANEDEELWKPIENYEGLYEVSNKGNVRSLDRDVQYKKTNFAMKIKGVDLKPNVLKKGYLQVGLSKNGKRKSMLVHRLVMNAFNPTTDESLQINHIDGNKENNEISNLEWVTAIDNINHAYDIGLRDNTMGNNRKLTEDEVLEIIDLYETGNFTQKELGNKYNVGRNTIGEILLGKTWGWLTGITREVEEEQKYYARIKGWELFADFVGVQYWGIVSIYGRLGFVSADDAKDNTKDEWKRLGIDDSNAEFVKVTDR